MKKYYLFYVDHRNYNDDARLLRETVNFMNNRIEESNSNKPFKTIIKEYLLYYYKINSNR
jgi:hypothetical protein